MPSLDTLKYDSLIAGDFDRVTQPIVIAASQTILRGDVLKKNGSNYERPTVAVVAADDVVVASEDVTTGVGETKASIGYKTGEFNQNAMRFGGSTTADDNRSVLADKSIYLKVTQKA